MAKFPLGFRFSRYATVRQVRFRSWSGKVDLVVVTDEPSILLVEAKRRKGSLRRHEGAEDIVAKCASASNSEFSLPLQLERTP